MEPEKNHLDEWSQITCLSVCRTELLLLRAPSISRYIFHIQNRNSNINLYCKNINKATQKGAYSNLTPCWSRTLLCIIVPGAPGTTWKIFTRHITGTMRHTDHIWADRAWGFMKTKVDVSADSGMLHLLMNPSEQQSSRLVLYDCSHMSFESPPDWVQLP